MTDLPSIQVTTIEAEQALLGKLLLDYEPHDVRSDDMLEPAHGTILTAIEQARGNGLTVDPITVASVCNDDPAFANVGGRGYFAKLAAAYEALLVPVRDLAAVVINYANRRRLLAISRDMAEAAVDLTREAPDTVAKAISQLQDIRNASVDTDQPLSDLGEIAIEELSRPLVSYSTGLQRLDDVLEGGLYPGCMYAFDGRMKMGKTVMLGTIARNLGKAGIPVSYFALEMGPNQISKRLIAADLQLNDVVFKRRNVPDLEERLRYWHENNRSTLRFENQPNLSFDRLKILFARHCRDRKSKVIVLDYWQLVSGRRPKDNEAQHLAEVAQWLAGAAKEYNAAVVTACQRNREGESRGGDGLKMACDVYFKQWKLEATAGSHREHVWLEMTDTRYTRIQDVGSENSPKLYIANIGPVIEEYR